MSKPITLAALRLRQAEDYLNGAFVYEDDEMVRSRVKKAKASVFVAQNELMLTFLIEPVVDDGWILCADQLPDVNGQYLTVDTYGGRSVRENRFSGGYWLSNDSTTTHWRPMPPLPNA